MWTPVRPSSKDLGRARNGRYFGQLAKTYTGYDLPSVEGLLAVRGNYASIVKGVSVGGAMGAGAFE